MKYIKVKQYFFVIKRHLIYNEEFKSKYSNSKIVVSSWSSKEEAMRFKRHLILEGLKPDKDFIEGFCSDLQVLEHDPALWLKFKIVNGFWHVKYKE